MTRRIAHQLGEVQYMLKQGSSWHDITAYYRARKNAVKLKAETGDKAVTQSLKREKSQKKKFQRNLWKYKKTLSSENRTQVTDVTLLLTFDSKYVYYLFQLVEKPG